MNFTGKLFLFVLMVIGVSACFDPPHFSNIPAISNPSVYFVEVSDTAPTYGQDTLAIVFHFTDGDGDDGLDPDALEDRTGIFTNHYYVSRSGLLLDPGDNTISSRYITRSLGDGTSVADTLLTFSDRRTGAPYDSLPEYDCFKYELINDDTIYQKFNPNNFNTFVRLYTQDPTTLEYGLFDFTTLGGCNPSGLYGRFPILFTDFSHAGPLEGTINYGMPASYWLTQFATTRMKLEVTIQDRSLNKSNTLTTDPFLIQDIRK